MMMKMSSVTIFSREKNIEGEREKLEASRRVQLCTVDRFLMNHWTILVDERKKNVKTVLEKYSNKKKLIQFSRSFLQFSLQQNRVTHKRAIKIETETEKIHGKVFCNVEN
jgi:hypothetical protein